MTDLAAVVRTAAAVLVKAQAMTASAVEQETDQSIVVVGWWLVDLER